MDGESGDSSSELHATSVPNADDSESHHHKLADIMCVTPEGTLLKQQPTDFSFKFNNNLTKFSGFENRNLEEKKTETMHRDPEKSPESEFEFRNRETMPRVADYLSNKDTFREFRNNLNAGASADSAIGLSKEQHMRATEFAVALNYNKDPHRTSDFAGMILQHHQRFVFIVFPPKTVK